MFEASTHIRILVIVIKKMPRAKISKLKSKKGKEMQGKIGDIMQGLLQTDRNSDDFSSMSIILHKYKKMCGLANEFVRCLLKLVIAVKDEYLDQQILVYRKKIIGEYKDFCSVDTTPYDNQLDITQMPKPMLKELRNKYLDLKDSFLVLTSVMIAKNILACKLDGKNITKDRYEQFCDAAFTGDTELRIFNYIKIGDRKSTIDFDFVTIFDNSVISGKYSPKTKLEIFELIVSMCECGRGIDRMRNEPDIDIADIFPKIIEMIDVFKGQLHGCDRAFDIIKKSSGIFERNCNKYIRKASCSGNPMSMFTEFIEDIIRENSNKINDNDMSSNAIIMELKKIIKEIRQSIEKAMRSAKDIPDNIRFVLDAAETYIEEFENDTSGEIPDIGEIRKRQQNFKDIYIP